jgi:hypothetical protein
MISIEMNVVAHYFVGCGGFGGCCIALCLEVGKCLLLHMLMVASVRNFGMLLNVCLDRVLEDFYCFLVLSCHAKD